MSDDPNARAPEPKPDERPEQPAASRPAETPLKAKAQAEADSKAKATSRGSPPKAVQPKPEPQRPAAKPAAPPKTAARVQRKEKPLAQQPAKKAPSKRATAAMPKAPQRLKPPEPARPAKSVQREAEPAPKPRAEKPASKAAAPKVEPVAARAEQPPPTKPPDPSAAPKPPASVVPVHATARPSPAAAGVTGTPTATTTPVVQRAAAAAETLHAIGRRIIGRLERTERALSPWTQQSLRLQQPAPRTQAPILLLATPEDIDAVPGTQSLVEAGRAARVESPAGSLAMRVQRQERQGATGTFGRLAEGVERADRFASRIVAHFPPVAAKYEPPPAPEAGAPSAPPAARGPTFTYYPESAASNASRQPTMTAAEVLERFGGTTTTSSVQRTAAPASEARKPGPPASKSPRDPRRLRRFSKIEELSPHSAAPAKSPAPPEARQAQRKPQAERPADTPPAAPRPPAVARAETPTPPRPPRRRSHSEEMGTPQQGAPPVQRTPSEPAKPTAPTPAATDASGPLRWDHLTNLPPSMQRQLERVQQQLSEQAGLVGPPVSIGNTERPLFPRNPNPPPVNPDRPTRARPASAGDEPETPIAFGPDLQPRPVAVQRQAQPPTGSRRHGELTPAPQPAAQPPTASRPGANRVEETGPEPEKAEFERTGSDAAVELTEPGATAPAIQRMPQTPPAPDLTLRGQEMPLVAPPERELLEPGPPEPKPEVAPPAPTEPAMPPAESEPTVALGTSAVQRSPEPGLPVETPLGELTLRQPPPAQPAEESPAVQRQPAEPTDRLRQVEPSTSKAAPMAEPTTPPLVTPAAEIAPPARPTPQSLILRQPARPEDANKIEAPAERVRPAAEPSQAVEAPAPSAPEPLPPQIDTPIPVVQRSPLPEQPLVLRQPPTPEVKPPAPDQQAAAAARGQAEPPSAPVPVEADKTLPETSAAPSLPVQNLVAVEPVVTATPTTEFQREVIEDLREPLPLRQPPPEAPAEPQSEPAKTAPEEKVGTASVTASVQRQALAADELPLRTPPPPPMDLPEAPADSAPAVSAPERARRATIQRQAESQPGPRPASEMPLRQPAAAPEQEPRHQPNSRGPELSLGRQIYARGVKDAQMPVFGALATNLRRNVQRNPAQPPAPGATLPFGPAGTTGQARTASGPTPVLPQARVQRLDNPDERLPSTLTRPNGPALQELDALPLAPPGPAPENPLAPNAPPTRRWQPATPRINNPNFSQSLQQPLVGEGVVGQAQAAAPATGGTWQRATPRMAPSNLSGSLPLAPVITRNGGNGQSQPPTTDDTQESNELDDLSSDEEDSTPETTDANTTVEQIDLDDLADQLMPYIKRLMAVERDRHDPV